MAFPRLIIDCDAIRHNARMVREILDHKNCSVFGVSKLFGSSNQMADEFLAAGIRDIADSRLRNLRLLDPSKVNQRILLRIAMMSEAQEVVEYADISLQSSIETIERINEYAVDRRSIHKIILMVDLGDLREGYFDIEELLLDVQKIKEWKGIQIVGVGTNMTCYGGLKPTEEHMIKLSEIAERIEEILERSLTYISGGNSSIFSFLSMKLHRVNNFRIGEGILLGRETAYGESIEGLRTDTVRLECEVIESKVKPSLPIGESLRDVFGRCPSFVDYGNTRRVICAIGAQDVPLDAITPLDPSVRVLGGSSDHLILSQQLGSSEIKVGQILSFLPSYVGVLRLMNSNDVEKVYQRKK